MIYFNHMRTTMHHFWTLLVTQDSLECSTGSQSVEMCVSVGVVVEGAASCVTEPLIGLLRQRQESTERGDEADAKVTSAETHTPAQPFIVFT